MLAAKMDTCGNHPFNNFRMEFAGFATDLIDFHGGPKAFNEIKGGLKFVSKMLDRKTIAIPDGPKKVVSSMISTRFVNTLFSQPFPGLPEDITPMCHETLKDIPKIGLMLNNISNL
jgi:hypothetical protein